MVKNHTFSFELYDKFNVLYKEIKRFEIASFKQRLIRWKYLIQLKKIDNLTRNIFNETDFTALLTQATLNSTNADIIYNRYYDALYNGDEEELDICFELMQMEYLRLKEYANKISVTDATILTKAEARVIIEKYKDGKATDAELLPYPKAKKLADNVYAFPER